MNHRFFRFPLPALAYGDDLVTRFISIVEYCVIDVGIRRLKLTGLSPDEIQSVDPATLVTEGSVLLGIRLGDSPPYERTLASYHAIRRFAGEAPCATVSIRAAWFWACCKPIFGEAIPPKPLNYLEFSVLCAILSKLGNKPLESCTWQEIRRRAMGYATQKEMDGRLPQRKDRLDPLSRQQIRTILDNLERNRFFARWATGNGRSTWITYYSFTMPKKKLITAAPEAFCQRRRRGHIKRTAEEKALAAAAWKDLVQRRKAAGKSLELEAGQPHP